MPRHRDMCLGIEIHRVGSAVFHSGNAHTAKALRAEAPLAIGIGTHRAKEVDAPEVGPVSLTEEELGMRRLPEKKSRQPLLARRANHQIGIWLTSCIKVLCNVLDIEQIREFFDTRSETRVFVK